MNMVGFVGYGFTFYTYFVLFIIITILFYFQFIINLNYLFLLYFVVHYPQSPPGTAASCYGRAAILDSAALLHFQ